MTIKNNKNSNETTYDERLKGTFISVIVIGGFIIIAWLSIFYFYISTV